MLEFNKYLMRHGESWIQDMIKRIERNEGVRLRSGKTLKERRAAAMGDSSLQQERLTA
ncbi:MAG: hypothetical protein P4M13_10265 [Alphaproteobacteria bacterium]|nr:hypothetical protein [Alphaproteobacteria bacterium]